jgi:CRISPR-associated protein Csm4
MPEFETFDLTFVAGLHIGRHGIGQEEAQVLVPSDTLFAALVTIRSQLKGDAGDWAEQFLASPPFRLTSAFPFAGEVHFYPRPVALPAELEPRQARRIRFVSSGIMQRLVSGDLPGRLVPPGPEGQPDGALTLQDGTLWLTLEEAAGLPEHMRRRSRHGRGEPLPAGAVQRQHVWAEATAPRVRVDRLTNASEIYHTGRVSFGPECGLWFGVQWHDHAERDAFLGMLWALGDSGLGAERSVGYGAFAARPGPPANWPDAGPEDLMLLLSRYYPREDETDSVAGLGTAYELLRVAGRVRTLGTPDQRRRAARLVAEGSLVGAAAQGTLADVTPTVGRFPHKVWRYGLATGIRWNRRRA